MLFFFPASSDGFGARTVVTAVVLRWVARTKRTGWNETRSTQERGITCRSRIVWHVLTNRLIFRLQRHLENYDANNDEDGKFLASMAPRQVGMPVFLKPAFLPQPPRVSPNIFDLRSLAHIPPSTDRAILELAQKNCTFDLSCPSPEPSGEKEYVTDGESNSTERVIAAPLGAEGDRAYDAEVTGVNERKRKRNAIEEDLAQEAANALIALAQKCS